MFNSSAEIRASTRATRRPPTPIPTTTPPPNASLLKEIYSMLRHTAHLIERTQCMFLVALDDLPEAELHDTETALDAAHREACALHKRVHAVGGLDGAQYSANRLVVVLAELSTERFKEVREENARRKTARERREKHGLDSPWAKEMTVSTGVRCSPEASAGSKKLTALGEQLVKDAAALAALVKGKNS